MLGLEKVERNVLPVLNNLLENREMALEATPSLLTCIESTGVFYNHFVALPPSGWSFPRGGRAVRPTTEDEATTRA